MTASPGLNQTPGFTESPTRPIQRRLYRSSSNRVFAGVCAGIADYFGADPTAVRLLTVIVALFTALIPVGVMYLVAAIVVPVRLDGEASPTTGSGRIVLAPGQGRLFLGILLVGFGALALANELFRINWDLLWPVALIGLGGLLVFAAQRR